MKNIKIVMDKIGIHNTLITIKCKKRIFFKENNSSEQSSTFISIQAGQGS